MNIENQKQISPAFLLALDTIHAQACKEFNGIPKDAFSLISPSRTSGRNEVKSNVRPK
jgi:hypothetical protein